MSRAAKARAARLRILRRVQQRLGRVHDLDVLIARIRALQGSVAVAGLQLSGELDRLVRSLEHECRSHHAKYITARVELLAVCARVERVAETGRKGSRVDGR